jgi:hypothetical protein
LATGERCGAMPGQLHGMRDTHSGWIDFDGYASSPGDWIGVPGDYLREPVFSAGAWRALAVMPGGLDVVVSQLCGQLRARQRHGSALASFLAMARFHMKKWFQQFALLASTIVGNPGAFLLSCLLLLIWAIMGPIMKFSDTWQLLIPRGPVLLRFWSCSSSSTRKTGTPALFA